MAEYLSPGVYIEEIEIGAKQIKGVSTSTAGFLGETERGPTVPKLVSSWLEYQNIFGDFFGDDKYLPYAVQGFFDNGGQRCYIGRIVKSGSVSATHSLLRGQDVALTVNTVGEGSWGNRIAIKVVDGTLHPDTEFKLSVYFWKDRVPSPLYDPQTDNKTLPQPVISEVFDNLSADPSSPNYVGKMVNGASKIISIPEQPGSGPGARPDQCTISVLNGGSDAQGPVTIADYSGIDPAGTGRKTGIAGFEEIAEISIVYAPDQSSVGGLDLALIAHCELLKDRFAIIDAPRDQHPVSSINPRDTIKDTRFAAYYYPWIKVISPAHGSPLGVPPGGHVAGIYTRSDNERGVHKAPANEVIRGATDLEFRITKGEQDVLNPRGVNVIRAFPGRGIRVWGARTLSGDQLWEYINVRRFFNYIEESIVDGTRWVVFETSNEKLWAHVRATITEFLTIVWHDGALMGSKPEVAFFVTCDRTTMTQDDINQGRLVLVIGVAPVKPAEFVIFRLVQSAGGSDVTD